VCVCVCVVNLYRQDALSTAGGKEPLRLNLPPEHAVRSCSSPPHDHGAPSFTQHV
jgi:hypothetical protein